MTTTEGSTGRALGQAIQATYERWRVYRGGNTATYQYAKLRDGSYAFRHKSDTAKRRSPLAWSRWKAVEGTPDLSAFEPTA